MNPEDTSSLTKMDKIRIVVEYNELSESKKADYLKENGIDKKTIETYQKEAAAVMGIAPPAPKTRLEKLIDALQDDNENVRKDTIKELGGMRHRAKPAIDAIIDRMLNDPIDSVRSWSSWALTRIEPRNTDVTQAFLKCLTEDEESLQARNWSVVGLSVSERVHTEKRLIEVLHTGKPFAQFASIEALSRIGTNSSDFIAGLEIALESPNESLQKLAELKLSSIRAED